MWARLPRLGIAGPRADEMAQARNSGSMCDVVGLVYGCVLCPARKPAVPHVNPLFCMWAVLPRLGIAGPRADEMARVRNSGFACDVVGLVYGCVLCSAGRPSVPHVNPLFRMWAGSPRLGIAGSRADEMARVRNSGFACVSRGWRRMVSGLCAMALRFGDMVQVVSPMRPHVVHSCRHQTARRGHQGT